MAIFYCPRCGEHKLEYMKSYSFCWECGYSPSDDQISRIPIERTYAQRPDVARRLQGKTDCSNTEASAS